VPEEYRREVITFLSSSECQLLSPSSATVPVSTPSAAGALSARNKSIPNISLHRDEIDWILEKGQAGIDTLHILQNLNKVKRCFRNIKDLTDAVLTVVQERQSAEDKMDRTEQFEHEDVMYELQSIVNFLEGKNLS
jgi:hypothetical protein